MYYKEDTNPFGFLKNPGETHKDIINNNDIDNNADLTS